MSKNSFVERIVSLRSARNPHVPGRTFRLLRAPRLTLHPQKCIFRDALKRVDIDPPQVERTHYASAQRVACTMRSGLLRCSVAERHFEVDVGVVLPATGAHRELLH